LILTTVGYLMATGIKETGVYYLTPTELSQKVHTDRSIYDVGIKIGAKVVKGSVTRDVASQTITFQVSDGAATYPIVYRGLAPDTFTDEAEVVVEGRLQHDGTFKATTLLAKCGSRFENAPRSRGAHDGGSRLYRTLDRASHRYLGERGPRFWAARRPARARRQRRARGLRAVGPALRGVVRPHAGAADPRLLARVRRVVHQPQPAGLLHLVGVSTPAEGLALFWAIVVCTWGSLALLFNRGKYRELMPYVAGVVCIVVTFFTAVMVFAANPFHRLGFIRPTATASIPSSRIRG